MIYVITVIRPASPRSVGYGNTEAEARQIVEDNVCDISEGGYYPRAVIEAVEPGVHVVPDECWYYEWDGGPDGSYKETPQPGRARGLNTGGEQHGGREPSLPVLRRFARSSAKMATEDCPEGTWPTRIP